MGGTEADEEREAEEGEKECEDVEEASLALLIEFFVGELDEGEAHVLPLVREDAALDVELADEPGAEVEEHVRD